MGQFIASISRGRKIWEVLLFSIVLPVVYCIVYFCVWGGIGLRQSRQALELKVFGETYFNNSNHFLVDGSELCQDVPQENLVIGEDLIFTNLLPGVTPVCVLDEEDVNSAAFHVFDSFAVGEIGLGPLLALLYMLTIVLFHMTTAASSSLVMDKLASNGRKNNHLARRMFWLLTAGAVTTVLLQTGGNALVVIQGALIVCCLPVSVLLCYVLQSIMLMCRATDGTDEIIDYVFPNQPEFDFPIYGGIFNVMEYIASLGKVNPSRIERGMNNATRVQCIEFFKGLFVPFVSLHQVLYLTYPENVLTNTALALFYTSCYLGWFGFIIVSLLPVGTSQRSMTWVLLVVNGCLLGHVRSGFRARYNLRSNTVGDVISSLILWPQVLSQMRLECVKQSKFNKVDSDNLTADEMTSNS